MRNYPFNKVIYKSCRYIFIIIDSCPKCLWAIPLKNKYIQFITKEVSNILTTSKRKPLKIESDRGTELYNSIFQNFLRSENMHQYSRFTDKGPLKAEKVIRTKRNLLRSLYFREEMLIG